MYPKTLRENEHSIVCLPEQSTGFPLAWFTDINDVKQVFGRTELVDPLS